MSYDLEFSTIELIQYTIIIMLTIWTLKIIMFFLVNCLCLVTKTNIQKLSFIKILY